MISSLLLSMSLFTRFITVVVLIVQRLPLLLLTGEEDLLLLTGEEHCYCLQVKNTVIAYR